MAKLWILSVLVVAAFVQVSIALDFAEVLNVNIREQLKLYDNFQKQADAAPHAEDLQKLVQITEGALKTESAEEKQQIINTIQTQFGEEFNKWIAYKLEEAQVHDDIHEAIQFYNSLLTADTQFEGEIKSTLSKLENLLKDSNLKQKEEQFLSLTKSFSPEFEKFLKESSMPAVNKQLQKTVEFFDNLLNDKDSKFAKEIEELKAKTVAAIATEVSLDEKNKVLQEVTFTPNKQLNEYLQMKNIEFA